jgi:hypothetical protein
MVGRLSAIGSTCWANREQFQTPDELGAEPTDEAGRHCLRGAFEMVRPIL